MSLPVPRTKVARFGLFEADLAQRLLTKGGLRVKLQEQPFQVLALLLERPGEVVTRDEIRQKLWTADTYVEFDDGLNTAIKKLRLALGDSADNPRFIETLPRRGYRFLAPVTCSVSAVPPEPPKTQGVAPNGIVVASQERSRVVIEQISPRSTLRWGLGALVLALLAGSGGYLYQSRNPLHRQTRELESASASGAFKPRPSVAVIGFRNLSGRPESAWLSTAIAEMLSTELAAGRKLRIVASENIARTKRELPLVDTDTFAPDTLSRLHTNLDADYVVLGSYTDLGQGAHGRIRLDLRLQDARTGEILAEEGLTGSQSNLFDLISEAGFHLREKFNAGDLSDEERTAVRASLPANPEATRYYADGFTRLQAYDNLAARDLLLRAVKLEPSHALAHLALAKSWKALGYDGNAREEAEKAWHLSKSLAREDQLWVEAYYREANSEWDKAANIYRTLSQFFPDNLEYGLRLVEVQSNDGKGKEAMETIAALRRLAPPSSDDPRIDLMESYALTELGDYKQLQSVSDNAARKAEERGARLLLARARLMQSTAARNLQDPQRAEVLDAEAEHIYQDTGDTYGATRARIRIADLLFEKGEFARSNAISAECLQVFRTLGSQRDVANALDDIGGGLIELGELSQAKVTYEKALAAQREVGNKRGIAQELNNLGVILEEQGDLAGALKTDEETRDAYETVGNKDGVASALNNIGEIHFMEGDLPGARKLYEQALALRTELANESEVAESKHNIAEVLGDQGDVNGAQKTYDEALATRVRRAEDGAAAQTRLGKAELLLETGKARDAEPLVRTALEQFKKEQQVADEVSAHSVLARTLLDLGRPREASSEIAQARKLDKTVARDSRFRIETTAAEVLSANGDSEGALRNLREIIRQANSSGFFMRRIEASLTLASIEMRAGDKTAAHAELASVEREANAKGYVLIARRASALQELGKEVTPTVKAQLR